MPRGDAVELQAPGEPLLDGVHRPEQQVTLYGTEASAVGMAWNYSLSESEDRAGTVVSHLNGGGDGCGTRNSLRGLQDQDEVVHVSARRFTLQREHIIGPADVLARTLAKHLQGSAVVQLLAEF